MEEDKHTCKKIKLTEQEADTSLRNMVENNDWRSWKRQTNCRKYACMKCDPNGTIFHLTSRPTIITY